MAAYEDEEEDTELDEDGKAKLPCLNCRLIQVLQNCYVLLVFIILLQFCDEILNY